MPGRLRTGSATTRRRFLTNSCLGERNNYRSSCFQPLAATTDPHARRAIGRRLG